MRQAGQLRILITGGGTGGHAIPAIATARAIVRLSEEAAEPWKPVFLYVGSASGVEQRLAAEAGIPFEAVQTGKLRRASNPLRMINRSNLRDICRVPVGVAQAAAAVARFKPDVVFSTGGYVSVPAALAASLRGVPVVAHEQTVQVGLANRLIMPRASRIALSYPESVQELSPALRKRVQVTGNPVRDGLFGGSAKNAAEWAGFDPADDGAPAVYVTGGAQGSRLINMAVAECLDALLARCRIIHQCGRQTTKDQDLDMLTERASRLDDALRRRYFAVPFVSGEIGDVYALATLIVARSGAGTVSEVCALGKPALFVPLVPTGGDEQTRNARRLESAGAARILRQDALSGETLRDAVLEMLSNAAALEAMGKAAAGLACPDAARDLARLVTETGFGTSTTVQ